MSIFLEEANPEVPMVQLNFITADVTMSRIQDPNETENIL